ncbi:hypothetical protein [Asticcacaulis sp. AC402]|uniref:hypothetical protein n=1 Tax=Asticcacaulis sp. AC402 TaxID=1282361 RepID=UPI0003C40432|nr:hypothetical protein [Asticcacaulis sp. AC402]ESQ76040.1 hypothetical protein ABAC402_06230 [Asticcacaulis sp. AC402]
MSDQDTSFAVFSRTYRPWGQVRRKNLISRILYAMAMTLVGLAVLAGLAVLLVMAGMVVVVGVVAFALMAVAALFTRKPSKVFVRTQQPRADGVIEARKKGSTWTVY